MNSHFFSLIVCTLGRDQVLDRLFQSLADQTYKKFEVILVDQNEQGFLDDIIMKYSDKISLKRVASDRGLSKARNVGLRHVTGDIVAFPDDDCWYPVDLLGRVSAYFDNKEDIDGITSFTIGKDGRQSVQKFNLYPDFITKYNVWHKANSTTMFIRTKFIKKTDLEFDEKLGVGANTPWGAGEDIDFLLRLLNEECKIYFDPKFYVYHPHLESSKKKQFLNRNISYARGTGYVIKKNNYSIIYFIYKVFRSLSGAFISLMIGDLYKSKVRFYKVKGFLSGWMSI